MDGSPRVAPKPLSEQERRAVRQLLRSIETSVDNGRNPLSRRKAKPIKKIRNPFEGIDEGKRVNGLKDLSPDCCTIAYVQRVKIVLLPFHYDGITMKRQEWIDYIEKHTGSCFSIMDSGQERLKFLVEGSAPIQSLHIYLETVGEHMVLVNFIFAT